MALARCGSQRLSRPAPGCAGGAHAAQPV